MSLKIAQTVSLVAATVATGITAGTLAAFAYSVMPGLHHLDDRTFVNSMNRMNQAILNGWFMLCFVGALLFIIAAGLLQLHRHERPVLYWLVAGVVLYAVVLIITSGVNVPLNNKMLHDGDQHLANFAAIRDHFESRWVTWNIIRVVINVAAFIALTGALVVHGRVSNSEPSTRQAHAHQAQSATTPASVIYH